MASIKEWLKKLINALTGTEKPATDQQTRPAQAPRPSEPYVFITTGGKKYHWDRLCPGLRNAKEVKMDLSKARKAGYTACGKCCQNYDKY